MATTGDILCVHIDNQPSVYARIEGFEPDHKRGWWQVHLLILSVPLQRVVWTLKEEYFNGTAFTMQGTPMQLIPLPGPAIAQAEVPAAEPETAIKPEAKSEPEAKPDKPAPVISLAERRGRKPNE